MMDAMPAQPDDIPTPRLVLRLFPPAAVDAGVAGDVAGVASLLGVAVSEDLLALASGLAFARRRLVEDPAYQPWSMRAIVLRAERRMVGGIRFHTRPDPEYLHGTARGAVELGYGVFPAYRGHGYAQEAARAVMGWARAAHGVRHFVASVSPENAASLAVVARLGFLRVGEQIDEIDGIEHVFLRQERD